MERLIGRSLRATSDESGNDAYRKARTHRKRIRAASADPVIRNRLIRRDADQHDRMTSLQRLERVHSEVEALHAFG